MQTSTQSAPLSLPAPAQSRRREDWTYQAVTVAAMLLVLGSLWVF
ncbi:MAG TPA: hypothetical protein VN776_16350 [Terracidiphilus sp.]|nr:hypothetical protein [Terracidiphilus sp.]